MRYLFSDWDKFFFNIQKSPHVFLFFDYDGTLTPIVSTPEKARFPRNVKDLIRRLNNHPKFTIAIISGRSLKDIKRMVGIKDLIYAGNHGLEIMEAQHKISRPLDASVVSVLKKVRISLQRKLRRIKGARVEDKGYTLSVHYRLVKPGQRIIVKDIVKDTVRPYVLSKEVRISSGKMVLEVRPAVELDKGKTVLYLLARKKRALPVYIGDDVTDRDAFRAIRGKGISIFVGRPKRGIVADYFLRSPKDVTTLLTYFF